MAFFRCRLWRQVSYTIRIAPKPLHALEVVASIHLRGSGLQTAAEIRLGYMSEATESSLHGSTQESLDFEARFIADNMRRIFRQIYRIVRNVDDAQDLTQEAFIKALQRRGQLEEGEEAAPCALPMSRHTV